MTKKNINFYIEQLEETRSITTKHIFNKYKNSNLSKILNMDELNSFSYLLLFKTAEKVINKEIEIKGSYNYLRKSLINKSKDIINMNLCKKRDINVEMSLKGTEYDSLTDIESILDFKEFTNKTIKKIKKEKELSIFYDLLIQGYSLKDIAKKLNTEIYRVRLLKRKLENLLLEFKEYKEPILNYIGQEKHINYTHKTKTESIKAYIISEVSKEKNHLLGSIFLQVNIEHKIKKIYLFQKIFQKNISDKSILNDLFLMKKSPFIEYRIKTEMTKIEKEYSSHIFRLAS